MKMIVVASSASIVALVLASSTSITHSFRFPSPTTNIRQPYLPIVVSDERGFRLCALSQSNYEKEKEETTYDITRSLFPEERDGGGIGRRQQLWVTQSSMNDLNSRTGATSSNSSSRRQLSSLSQLAIDPVRGRGGLISSFSSAFNYEEKSEMNNRRPPNNSIVGMSTSLVLNDSSSGQTQGKASVLYQRMRGMKRQQDIDSSSNVLSDQRRMKQLKYVENEKLKRERIAAEMTKIEKERLIAVFEKLTLAKQQQQHEAERMKEEQLTANEETRLATEKATLEKDLLLAEANRLRQEIIDEDTRLETKRLEHDRLNTEAAKLASKTATLEKERLLQEAERLRQEIATEESRFEDERLERERVRQEEMLERERLAATFSILEKERLMIEAERIKQERVVEVRLEAERIESEKFAAEVEKERLMVQKQVDEARIVAEQLESTKLAAELARLETERLMAEAERLKQENDIEEARIEAERLKQQRIAAEEVEYAEIQRLEREKLVAETARIQAEKVAAEAERIKQEKLVNEARLEVEKLERERQKQEVARQAEFERLENERIMRDKLADEVLLEMEQLKRQRLVDKVARQDDLERLEKMRLIASRKRLSVVGDYDKAALSKDEMIKKKYRDVKAMMLDAKTLPSVDFPSRANMNTVAKGATPTTLSEIKQKQLLRGDEIEKEKSATYLDIAKVFRGKRPGQRDSYDGGISRAPMVVAEGNRHDDYNEESFDITRRHFDSDRGSFMLRVNSGTTRRRGTTSGQVVSGSYDDWVGRSRAARLGRPMAEIIAEEDDEDILYEPTRPRGTATGQAVSGSYNDWVGRSRKAVLGRRISVESKAKEDDGDIINEPRFSWGGVDKCDVGYLDAHSFSKLDRTSSVMRDAKNLERRTRLIENQSSVDSTDIYNHALLSTKKEENREEDKVRQPEEVMYWILTHLPNLQEEDAIAYFNQLLDDGFDSSDVLNEIVDEDLHFMKKGHRKGLMRSLRGVNVKDDAFVNKSVKTSSADAFGDMVADMMLPDYVPDSVEDAIGNAIGDAIGNVATFLHGDTITKDDASADKSATPSSADAFGDMVADMMIPDYVPDSVEDAIGNAIGDAIGNVTKFLQGETGNRKKSSTDADTSETELSDDAGDQKS